MTIKRRLCATCNRNRAEQFFVSTKGRVCLDCQRKNRRKNARTNHVARTYGINAEEYEALLEFQGQACAICGGTRKTSLDIDHCHKTGVIRGALCRRCNRWLLPGSVNDIGVLAAAIHYLQHPPAVKLLGERKVEEK